MVENAGLENAEPKYMSGKCGTDLTIPDKKLSYRIGTARHAMLVNLCYVSRDM